MSPSQAITTATATAPSTIPTLIDGESTTPGRRPPGDLPISLPPSSPGSATLAHGNRKPPGGTDRERVRRTADGGGQGQEPRRARVPPGGPGGADSVEPVLDAHPEYRRREDPRADHRARARDHVPRAVGRRPRRGPGQPRLPRRDEQRARPVQGRPAVPPVGLPRHPEVPRVRAGLQERADHAADGRRQGRLGLRPQGQDRRRGDAVLPELHDRAAAPHRPEHRRARRRHRRRRPRDRLPVRPVQAAAQRVHRRAHRQGPRLGRLADPARGDRATARVYFAARDARDARRDASRARPASSPAPATSRSTRSRSCSTSARSRHALRLGRVHLRPGRHRPREARVGDGAQERAARPHRGVRRAVPGRDLHAVRPERRRTTRCGACPADCAFPSATQNEIDAQGRGEPARAAASTSSPRAPTCRPSPEGVDQFVDARHPLRPGQGGQRRRRRRLGAGDGAELACGCALDPRGGRRPAAATS